MRALLALAMLAATAAAGPFEDAQVARREGRYADAAALFEKAAAGADDARAATCWNKAGVCFYLIGRAEDARDRFARGLVLRTRVHGGDHADIAESLGNVGAALVALDRPAEALPYMEKALAMWRRLGQPLAASIDNYANCLLSLGRAEEARKHYVEALAAAADDPGLAGRIRRHLGNSLVALGRAGEALPHFEQALAAAERLGGDPTGDLNDLANCLDALGRSADALTLHQRALRSARERHGDAHPAIATSLNNLGACLDSLGRPDEALPHYEQALAMRRTLFDGDHRDVFASLNNLADCLMTLQRAKDARPHCEEALAMAQRLFDGDHAYRAGAGSNLASCLEAIGRPSDALPHHRAALAMAERLFAGDHPEVARSLNNVAMCLVALERSDEARPLLRRGLSMVRRLDAPAEQIVLASNLGRLLDGAEAVSVFGEAIAQMEALRHGARGLEVRDRAAFFRHLKRYGAYEGMIRAQLALGRADEALRYLERGRARTIADLLARSRFDPLAEVARRARERKDDAMLARVAAVSDRLRNAEQDVVRARHELSLAQKRKLIRQRRAELAAARRAQQVALRERAQLVRDLLPAMEAATPEALQRLVGRGERMLVYSLTAQSGLLLVVPPVGDTIRGHVLAWPDGAPVTDASVAAAVAAYRKTLVDKNAQPAGGARLFRALVPRDAWTDIAKAKRVHLVPHAALHRLPFETLAVDDKERVWLDAGPPIVYAPSGSVLLWCRRRADEQARRKLPYELVALGDPIFARPGRRSTLPGLPGTRREVQTIRDTLAGKRVALLLGEDACKAKLFDLAPQARYLHLATHQIADETEGGSYSRLALTVPAAATPGDDGFLRLLDLFEHWRDRLSGCELVVLSACETQRGPVQRDEGVFALPLGLMYAGCPSLVASLWRVDDKSTADLMSDFYRRLAAGERKADAFTAAQRALRRKYPHPYFWAPFIYIGDAR